MIELNKVFHEDCLTGMKKIPDGSVSLVVTDPPYLLNNAGGGEFTRKTTNDTPKNSKTSKADST